VTRVALMKTVSALPGNDGPVVNLVNADFESGTYRVLTPGVYRLTENIVFNPKRDLPTKEQLGDGNDQYSSDEYGLGFFAAMTVETSGVEIDLNGFTFEQGAEHALMMRLFSVIELARSPFVVGKGAANVYIHGGRIGRSAQHGIHGNANADIHIEKVVFDGFEVAAVALHSVERMEMNECTMRNRKDVPVLGTFAAARFLQRYVDYLVDSKSATTLNVAGVSLNAVAIRDSLKVAVNNVYNDVIANSRVDRVAHPEEYGLFANEARLTDGNGYCVVTNPSNGGGDGVERRPSRGVTLRDLTCNAHRIHVKEVVALRTPRGSAVKDVAGSILQILNKGPNGDFITIGTPPNGDTKGAWYTGNVVANAEFFVAKAALCGDFDGSDLKVVHADITKEMIAWVEAGVNGVLGDLVADAGFICNGNGVVSCDISGTYDSSITNVRVDGTDNDGTATKSDLYGDYTGANARAFSFAGSRDIAVRSSSVVNLASENGEAVAFDVSTDSKGIVFTNVAVAGVRAQNGDAYGVRFGESTSGNSLTKSVINGVRAFGGVAIAAEGNGVDNVVKWVGTQVTPTNDKSIPREILSYTPPGSFVFPLARYYVTSFKTDLSALEGILPGELTPMPGAEDNVLLQVNDFAIYWEAVLSFPAVFTSNGEETSGIFLSQLYLGAIAPEGSTLPMLLGQMGGYPKRDAIFTVDNFGEKHAEVKFDRWGTTIVDMKHEMGEEVTDRSNLPFGSDLSNLTGFLYKAIPAADLSGMSVLQLTTPKGADGKIVRVNKVDTTFNGDVVLDSGRVLPVKEIEYSLYYEIKEIGLSHCETLHDYLALTDSKVEEKDNGVANGANWLAKRKVPMNDKSIPKEILSHTPPPPYFFPVAKYYVTSFKTDLSALAGILPDKLTPMPGAEDNVLLQVNDFTTYWEAVLSFPAVFTSNGEEKSGIYLSQLYLGSITPEGSALPTMIGQTGIGYPKRDAIFTVDSFGEKHAEVKFQRWGITIADLKHEMGEEVADRSNLPFGSDLSNMTGFLLKAIPAADSTGMDVLQLTTPKAPKGGDGEIVRLNKVETTIVGDVVVLDSGRVLPVKEIQYSLYYEIAGAGLSHGEVLNDYLA